MADTTNTDTTAASGAAQPDALLHAALETLDWYAAGNHEVTLSGRIDWVAERARLEAEGYSSRGESYNGAEHFCETGGKAEETAAMIRAGLAAPAAQEAAGTVYVEARECGRCGHVGINDAPDISACTSCEWHGPSPTEDLCPGCGQTGTMTTACPECGHRTSLLASVDLPATPPRTAAQEAEPATETPEGCTPADARMLRKANHDLAAESFELQTALRGIVAQAGKALARFDIAPQAPAAPTAAAAEASELDLDRVLQLADEHADDSREDGTRVIDRGGLLAFAKDLIRIFAAAPAPAAGAAPIGTITQSYTVAKIRELFASGNYSAELMLQHALLHLGAGAAPTDAEGTIAGWKSHAEAMERERDYYRQRVRTMHEHQDGAVWYWQNDGEDHPESMVGSLPVVIRADQLRALLAAAPAQEAEDAALLDFIGKNYLDLRCFDMPTGQGDADIGWRIVQHHMGAPHERVVSEVYADDPRQAVREAMARLARDPHCQGELHPDDAARARQEGQA